MKSKIKKISLVVASLSCLTGCNLFGKKDSNEQAQKGPLSLDLWSCSSGEKVFLDQPVSAYSTIRGDAKVEIDAFKGEHEAKQLIITPNQDVDCFDAEVSDLKTATGETISKEKVTIYAEKYVALNQLYDTMSTYPIGRCPDGLVCSCLSRHCRYRCV